MGDTTIINLSRMIALENSIDITANNVANIGTVGFRAKQPTFREYLSKDDEPNESGTSASMVDLGRSYTDPSRGQIQPTGNPLDVAIKDEAYFVIQTAAGERYTRDGSFTLDDKGRLVTMDGNPVMTESGALSIPPSESNVAIGADAAISNKKGILGRLRLVTFDDIETLRASGSNLFSTDSPTVTVVSGNGRLEAGALEKSNVQSVFEMSRLAEATRMYEIASSLLKESQNYDDLNKLANVPE